MKMLIMGIILLLSIQPCRGMQIPVSGLDELWQETQSYGVSEETEFTDGVSALLMDATDHMGQLLRGGVATALKLMAVVLLCSLAQAAGGETKNSGLRAWELTGALTITALTMTDMAAMIGLGRDTIGKMDVFSKVLLPVMATLTAATGNVSGAALRQGATVFFSQILIAVMDRLLIPLVYAYVAVGCTHAAVGNPGLERLAGLLKSTVTFVLSAILLVFVGYLTASGAIAGSADASAIKVVRMTMSRAIPVVGGILADASESVLVGAGVLKGTVGAAGLLVVLTICLIPFLHLAMQYLTYKMTAALCATVAQPRLSRLIDTIGAAFGLVLGMTGAAAVLLMIGIVSAISVTVR